MDSYVLLSSDTYFVNKKIDESMSLFMDVSFKQEADK